MITASLSSTGGHGPGLSSIGRVLGEGGHTTHASSSQGALRVEIGAKTYSGDDCDQGDVACQGNAGCHKHQIFPG